MRVLVNFQPPKCMQMNMEDETSKIQKIIVKKKVVQILQNLQLVGEGNTTFFRPYRLTFE